MTHRHRNRPAKPQRRTCFSHRYMYEKRTHPTTRPVTSHAHRRIDKSAHVWRVRIARSAALANAGALAHYARRCAFVCGRGPVCAFTYTPAGFSVGRSCVYTRDLACIITRRRADAGRPAYCALVCRAGNTYTLGALPFAFRWIVVVSCSLLVSLWRL